MARRKYRSDAVSTAGHSEAAPPPDAADESFAQPLSPKPEYGKPDEAAPEPVQHYDVSGLKAQIAQQQQHAQLAHLHGYIAAHFSGALPHEARWLMTNPHHLQNPQLVHAAAQIAAQRNIPRNSPEFLHFVGQLLDQHAAAQMQPAPPPPIPPPVTHVDLETESHDTEPEGDHMLSHHVSAPVSRGDAGGGHTYESEPSHRVVLTPEERELDETVYAANKLKLQRMKRSKLISD